MRAKNWLSAVLIAAPARATTTAGLAAVARAEPMVAVGVLSVVVVTADAVGSARTSVVAVAALVVSGVLDACGAVAAAAVVLGDDVLAVGEALCFRSFFRDFFGAAFVVGLVAAAAVVGSVAVAVAVSSACVAVLVASAVEVEVWLSAPSGSAQAIAGAVATALPIPRATASAPTRPT
jgi:hypothetical protein